MVESRTYGSVLPGYVLRSLELEATDGRQVELRKGTTALQWRYVGDPTWNDLVPLSAITGPAGATGARGPEGIQGIRGQTGLTGATGPNGTQWLYGTAQARVATAGRPGDWWLEPNADAYKWLTDSWVFQVSIKGLKGDTGAQGPQGTTGTQGLKGDQGQTGATGQGFTFRGPWAASTAYALYDVVTYAGSSFTPKAAFTSGTTFDSSNWNVLAQAGSDGVQNVNAPLQYDSSTKTLSIDTSQLGTNAVQSIGYTWLFSL